MNVQTLDQGNELREAYTKLSYFFEHLDKKKMTKIRCSTAENNSEELDMYRPFNKLPKDMKNEDLQNISTNLSNQLNLQMGVIKSLVKSALDDVEKVFNNLQILEKDEQSKK